MTITQFIASLLYVASYATPSPEFHRHVNARRHLMQALRGVRMTPLPHRAPIAT